MKFRFDSGIALIFVLSLMLIFSLISLHLIQSTLLMRQLFSHLEEQFAKNEQMENEIKLYSKKMLKKIKESEIALEEAIFVPDHLSFGLTAGIWVMPIKIPANNIQNYIAIRKE